MSLNELLPILKDLPKVDKLHAVQFLVNELAREEEANLVEIAKDYPIWSPYNAFEASDTLLKMLASEQSGNDA